MIIVAQNRTRTVNFDLVEEINIKFNKKDKKYAVVAEMNSGKTRLLGKYDTKEYAMEIKQDIEDTIAHPNTYLPIYYMYIDSKKKEEKR